MRGFDHMLREQYDQEVFSIKKELIYDTIKVSIEYIIFAQITIIWFLVCKKSIAKMKFSSILSPYRP